MCGIVGGVGKLDLRTYLLSGLKKLEYRGYDSAGICYVDSGKTILHKVAGRVASLEDVVPMNISPTVGSYVVSSAKRQSLSFAYNLNISQS